MSYQVLARKWRPRNFAELVGQEHVVRALSNALDHERLHHAYLFTGTRGVGKTTLARILAKSLNCEQGISSRPCGECASCREIDEGRFVDLLEVDAASRTKVDETRDLLENVPYAPVTGRYKVYLIDEVHMFSTHSFNALLKTLEEPPPHVKFLLATTDPQKLPVTILSRCLQFNLKHLPAGQIHGQLEHILGEEGVDFEPAAIQRLARAADGSMRDALSLLDQAIGFGAGHVADDDVRAMLGGVGHEQVSGLLGDLASGDAARVMTRVAGLAEHTPDFPGVLRELLRLLHRLALVQAVPGVAAEAEDDPELLRSLGERLAPEDVQLFYQIGLIGQRDLPLAPDPRSGLEMVLLRMLAFRPASADDAARPAGHAHADAGGVTPSATTRAAVQATPVAETKVQRQPTGDLRDWHRVVAELGLKGMARELANNCEVLSWEDDRLTLAIDPSHVQLRVPKVEERLREALKAYVGRDVELRFAERETRGETPALREARGQAERQRAAEAEIAADPLVHALEETFSAQLVPDSIKPLER